MKSIVNKVNPAGMSRQRKNSISKGKVIICAHTVEWWLEGDRIKLSDIDVEHITNMLIENYVEGELCTITPDHREARGWWIILN